ncbi:MAG: hypothetical protein Q9191_002512 [Dirinaria sp. TL-2023a]
MPEPTTKPRPYNVESTGKCNRCLEAKAACDFAPLASRQRRKRTDARVSSLENELHEMKSMLQRLHASSPAEITRSSGSSMRITPIVDSQLLCHQSSSLPVPDGLAAELFRLFVDSLLPQYPIIEISESFEALRTKKPILLLACVTAASSTQNPSQFETLHACLTQKIIDSAIIKGNKSIELIQSMLILASWYNPPDDLRNLNFYQWFHIANTMAVQLGLSGSMYSEQHDYLPHCAEKWRTMLAVFQACSSAAISLRRRCSVTFTSSVHLILDLFESLAITANDKRLAAWLKLQLIADKIEQARRYSTDFEIDALVCEINEWESGLGPEIINGSLYVHLHYCKARLFENILFTDHNFEELTPPYVSKPDQTITRGGVSNPVYAKAVIDLILACHAILDGMILMEDDTLRGCPTFTYAKALYALRILSLIQATVSYPRHALSQFIDERNLRIENYFDQIRSKLRVTAGEMMCRVPSIISGVVENMVDQIRQLDNFRHQKIGSLGDDTAARQMRGHGLEVSSQATRATFPRVAAGELGRAPYSLPAATLSNRVEPLELDALADMPAFPRFENLGLPVASQALNNQFAF